MLKVKTYLDKSPIHGIGVFAGENIKKGTIVWTMVEGFDMVLSKDFLTSLPPQAKKYLDTYSYTQKGVTILTGDNDRFINHSEAPLARQLPNNDMIATRDIKKGEELTMDYREFDDAWQNKLVEAEAAA